jgi:TPR repeat protein
MYFNGQGCAKNQNKGYEWLFLAAQKGDYPTLLIIAKLYFAGAYVKQSDVEGTAWLLIAHKVGLLEGSIELAGLRIRFSAKELEKLLEKAEKRVNFIIEALDEK